MYLETTKRTQTQPCTVTNDPSKTKQINVCPRNITPFKSRQPSVNHAPTDATPAHLWVISLASEVRECSQRKCSRVRVKLNQDELLLYFRPLLLYLAPDSGRANIINVPLMGPIVFSARSAGFPLFCFQALLGGKCQPCVVESFCATQLESLSLSPPLPPSSEAMA